MTTVAERIAELQARAAARGLPLAVAQPRAIRMPPQTLREPPPTVGPPTVNDRWRTAARRQPPQAWKRAPDDRNDRRAIVAAVELRLIARQIAACLGDGWTSRPAQHDDGRIPRTRYLIHEPTGASVTLSYDWRTNDRITACVSSRTTNRQESAITMSSARTPQSLADDIHRRIVSRGLFAARAAYVASQDEQRQHHRERLAGLVRISAAAGQKINPDYHRRSPADSKRIFRRDGVHPENEYSFAHEFGANCDYSDRYELTIRTESDELAALLAAVYRSYVESTRPA